MRKKSKNFSAASKSVKDRNEMEKVFPSLGIELCFRVFESQCRSSVSRKKEIENQRQRYRFSHSALTLESGTSFCCFPAKQIAAARATREALFPLQICFTSICRRPRTFEVRIADPVLLLGAVELRVTLVVTIVRVVLEIAVLCPQNAINFFGAVLNVDVLEESSSQNAHAARLAREAEEIVSINVLMAQRMSS